jgi:hypothetical protein
MIGWQPVRMPTNEVDRVGLCGVGPLHACTATGRTVDFHMARFIFRIMEVIVAALQHGLSFERKAFHIEKRGS